MNNEKNNNRIPIAGILILAFGAALLHDFYVAPARRMLPVQLGALIFFGPVIFAAGGTLVLVGFSRSFKGSIQFQHRIERLDVPSRIFLWMLVGATLWPYWWLNIWTRANGERVGNEGEGMFGFLIMILAGLPSLLLAIANECRLFRRRKS